MRPQATTYNIVSEADQQEKFDLSSFLNGYLIKPFKDKLPEAKVLSYLTTVGSESLIQTLQVSKTTVPFKEHGTPPSFPQVSTPPRDNFVTLQKWEGVVMDVTKDSFIARLYDLDKKSSDEEAEFPCEEISEEDRELIMPGAIFYWNIGYHDSWCGQRRRSSVIRFRRLPAWRAEEIEASKREAERIKNTICME